MPGKQSRKIENTEIVTRDCAGVDIAGSGGAGLCWFLRRRPCQRIQGQADAGPIFLEGRSAQNTRPASSEGQRRREAWATRGESDCESSACPPTLPSGAAAEWSRARTWHEEGP